MTRRDAIPLMGAMMTGACTETAFPGVAGTLAGAALGLALLCAAAAPAAAQTATDGSMTQSGDPHANVIMYHRFGESGTPSTNIRLDQFDAHLAALTSNQYRVVPLKDAVEAARSGRRLPDNAVAITIDDAYASVYEHAWPRFRAAGLPFALFVATEPVDRSMPGYMTWAQIQELAEAGVEIGSQTVTHLHMPLADPARNLRELRRSRATLKEKTGIAPRYFAYPYGEASRTVMELVAEAGYEAAFGQHSGVVNPTAPVYFLPRFALNEAYGDMDRFRLIARALPLPVSDVTPDDPLLTVNPPAFGFTAEIAPRGLACYASHEGQLEAETLGRRVEIRLATPFPSLRGRINCTMPGPDGRWRWFGYQFVTPPALRP